MSTYNAIFKQTNALLHNRDIDDVLKLPYMCSYGMVRMVMNYLQTRQYFLS